MSLRLIGELAGRVLGTIRHDECNECGAPIRHSYSDRTCTDYEQPETDC